MADYFCVCMMQYVSSMPCNRSRSWLTRKRYTEESVNSMLAIVRAGGRKLICFRCRRPLVRVYGMLVLSSFSNKFNIMSAISNHQSPTLPQKIDSREGWFWWKKGVAYECCKMNFYLKRPPFAPDFGLFAPKYTAFWCKTHCVLVQNALRFGAKCTAFWC